MLFLSKKFARKANSEVAALSDATSILKMLAPPHERFDRRQKATAFSVHDALLASRELVPREASPTIDALEGGFSNANFLVQIEEKKWIVRFYPDGEPAACRETAILNLAHAHGIQVPRVVGPVLTLDGKTSIILEFIEGPLVGNGQAPYREIGRQLGKIHRITFERSGLIGASGKVEVPFENSIATAQHYIMTPLAGRAGQRLGKDLVKRVRLFVEMHWHFVSETFSGPALIHCDFNPKNLIVGPGQNQITVIDWEFSIAGHRLCDLGNFLRFDEDYTPQMRRDCLEGYQEIRGPLPENWEIASKLLDLASICFFLDNEDELPRTFRTARYVIDKTLKREF